MISIGLTGNVASGKTVVADRWREAGVRVIDADRLGHDVLREDEAVRSALVDVFGESILDTAGAIDRAALGKRAFATDEGLQRLNAIVHPPLLARLRAALICAEADGGPLAVVAAALVFEFGLDRELDLMVLVTAPEELRAEPEEPGAYVPFSSARRWSSAPASGRSIVSPMTPGDCLRPHRSNGHGVRCQIACAGSTCP